MSIIINIFHRYKLCSCIGNITSSTKTVPQCNIRECDICFNRNYISNTKYYRCDHNNICKECIKRWCDFGNNCPTCRAERRTGYKYRID